MENSWCISCMLTNAIQRNQSTQKQWVEEILVAENDWDPAELSRRFPGSLPVKLTFSSPFHPPILSTSTPAHYSPELGSPSLSPRSHIFHCLFLPEPSNQQDRDDKDEVLSYITEQSVDPDVTIQQDSMENIHTPENITEANMNHQLTPLSCAPSPNILQGTLGQQMPQQPLPQQPAQPVPPVPQLQPQQMPYYFP